MERGIASVWGVKRRFLAEQMIDEIQFPLCRFAILGTIEHMACWWPNWGWWPNWVLYSIRNVHTKDMIYPISNRPLCVPTSWTHRPLCTQQLPPFGSSCMYHLVGSTHLNSVYHLVGSTHLIPNSGTIRYAPCVRNSWSTQAVYSQGRCQPKP
jgi:hypothetical protein